MFNRIEIFQMAFGLARHAAARQAIAARNVANADTPGFKAKDLTPFSETFQTGLHSPDLRISRRGHIRPPDAVSTIPRTIESGETVSPNGNSVSLESEMVRSSEIRKQHELALSIYSTSLNILRASIGRK